MLVGQCGRGEALFCCSLCQFFSWVFFSRWGSGAYESGYNNKSAMGGGAGNYADYGYGAEAYGVCLTFSFVSVL